MKIVETAINSADIAEVTAINTNNNEQTAPPFPNNATAAFGNTKPALTCSGVNLLGYVGQYSVFSNDNPTRPKHVEVSIGIANHANPPKT